MGELHLTAVPVMKTGMLIRKPIAEVFDAFVNPAITTRFWFTKSSGRLEAGKKATWTWEMYNVSTEVIVKTLEAPRRLVIQWDGVSGPTTVEWRFTAQPDGSTFVSITNHGFSGTGDAVTSEAMDSTQGFALLLAGAKAFLEHGIQLNLVGDKHPPGLVEDAG